MSEKGAPEIRKIGLHRPTQVRMGIDQNVYFVTVWKNGTIEIRPKGSRTPESVVLTTIDAVYKRAMLARAKPKRRRPTSRGMLSTERTRAP